MSCACGVPRASRWEARGRRAPHSRMGYAPWGTPVEKSERGKPPGGRRPGWPEPHRANPSLSAIFFETFFSSGLPYGEVSELAEGTRLEIA